MLPSQTSAKLDYLIDSISYLEADEEEPSSNSYDQLTFNELKSDPGRAGVDTVLKELSKLRSIRNLELPDNLFKDIPSKILKKYRQRVSTEDLRELRRHPEPIRYTLLSAFFWLRSMEITDNLVDLLVQIIHRNGVRAEKKIKRNPKRS